MEVHIYSVSSAHKQQRLQVRVEPVSLSSLLGRIKRGLLTWAHNCHEIRFLGLISCSHDLIFSYWTYYSYLFPMDYLSYSCFLTNFTPRKGDQGQPSMGLLAIGQLEQVYGTVYVY